MSKHLLNYYTKCQLHPIDDVSISLFKHFSEVLLWLGCIHHTVCISNHR